MDAVFKFKARNCLKDFKRFFGKVSSNDLTAIKEQLCLILKENFSIGYEDIIKYASTCVLNLQETYDIKTLTYNDILKMLNP